MSKDVPVTRFTVEFSVAAPDDVPAREALSAYLRELAERFPEGFDVEAALDEAPVDFSAPRGRFVVGRVADAVVACGAVRFLDDDTGELKRMWVRRDARGRGIGAALLASLELEVHRAHRRRVVLDTHDVLVEAQGLYASHGYREVDAYNDNPHAAHWFEKLLEVATASGELDTSAEPAVHVGNAHADGPAHGGWLLGHFMTPTTTVHSDDVEIKWDVHLAGEARTRWVERDERTAVCVLVRATPSVVPGPRGRRPRERGRLSGLATRRPLLERRGGLGRGCRAMALGAGVRQRGMTRHRTGTS